MKAGRSLTDRAWRQAYYVGVSFIVLQLLSYPWEFLAVKQEDGSLKPTPFIQVRVYTHFGPFRGHFTHIFGLFARILRQYRAFSGNE